MDPSLPYRSGEASVGVRGGQTRGPAVDDGPSGAVAGLVGLELGSLGRHANGWFHLDPRSARPGNRGCWMVVQTMSKQFKGEDFVVQKLPNRWGRLVVVSVLLTIVLVWAAAADAAPGWNVTPSVDPSASTNVLNAVAVSSSSDAWAVGQFLAPDQDDDGLNMLTERWNGTAWRQVPTPAVLHQSESLPAVSASSANDA